MSSTPEGDEPSPILGLKPFQQATEVFGRATKDIITTQRKTNQQLESLTKALNTLASSLGKGGSGGGGGGTSGHSYGQLGGGSSFGGRSYNQHPQGGGGQPQQPPGGGQQPPKPGNGGSPNFSFWGYNQTPSATAPGKVARFAAAWNGQTPKQWNTQYNTLEMGAQVGSHLLGRLGQRGLDQLDQETLGDLMRAEELSYGGSRSQAEARGGMASLGSRSNTADNVNQTFAIGADGRSSIQSMQDLYSGEALLRRFSGSPATQAGQDRKKSVQGGADMMAYTNPTMSYAQSNQVASNMLKPSNRLNMMLMGLPDPTGPDGAYTGNANFFAAFLKRIYQGRESVPMNVFEDDFRETGVGWANLIQIVGEEGADAMLPGLRAYNLAKSKGKNTGNFDQLFKDANASGSKGDKARETLKKDYGVSDTRINSGNRQRVQDLASEMAGNEEYVSAERSATEAMHLFSEAVHSFVNAPLIGDVVNFLKGIGPGLSKASQLGDGSLMNILGMGSLTAQGPDDRPGGGPAHVSSGGQKKENLGADVASRARTYATGSRKYQYSMPNRNKDGFFDCSSFVSRVYKQFGYNVGPTTVQMWKQGEPVDLKDVQPGDLVLWARGKPGAHSGGAEHVEMYIGNGKTVGTASAGKGQNTIQVQPYRPGDWDAARRIVGSSKRGKAKKDVTNIGTSDDGTSTDTGGDTSSSDGGGSFLGSLGKAVSSLFGGSSSTAGTGSSVAGLGAGNASAYSTNELSALMGILSGGGGSGPGMATAGDGVSGEDSGTGSEEKVPYDAKGTHQIPDKEATKGADQSGSDKLKLGQFRLDKNAKTKNYAPEKHPTPNVNANKAVARRMLKSFGWDDGQWDELEKLWNRESSWNQYADNAGSDAYGIPQSLPGTKMASAGKDWRSNPQTQIKWGLNYIKGRYGNPTKAWAHSQSKGWYDSGAWQVQDDQEAVVHKGEMILPAQQAQTIRDALIRENLGGKVTGEQAGFGGDSGAKVEINFSQGAIVMQFGADVSASAGQSAARGFLKELQRHELYKDIARGGGKKNRV